MSLSTKRKNLGEVKLGVRNVADSRSDNTKKPSRRPAQVRSENVWTFLTNHSHVLICLAEDPDLRLRDVASLVGITERAVQRIVADLEEVGVLARSKDGRRNQYTVDRTKPLRHPIEAHKRIGDLLKLVEGKKNSR